jgi:hypothetical protein
MGRCCDIKGSFLFFKNLEDCHIAKENDSLSPIIPLLKILFSIPIETQPKKKKSCIYYG